LSKLIHNFYHGKKIGASFVFFKTLPKINDCPIGENSPNQVTLHQFLVKQFSLKAVPDIEQILIAVTTSAI
jgi:hypothetical protein